MFIPSSVQRLQVAREILVTERKYVADLNVLIDVFQHQIIAQEIISEKVRLLALHSDCIILTNHLVDHPTAPLLALPSPARRPQVCAFHITHSARGAHGQLEVAG
jgi:hypothetical protein